MTDCHILLVSLKCIQTLKKEPSASREIAQSSGFLRKCQRQGRSDFSEQNKRKGFIFSLCFISTGEHRGGVEEEPARNSARAATGL